MRFVNLIKAFVPPVFNSFSYKQVIVGSKVFSLKFINEYLGVTFKNLAIKSTFAACNGVNFLPFK